MSGFFSRRQASTSTTQSDQATSSESPKPSLPRQPIGFDTVLGASCTLEGKLESSSNIRLDGKFSGSLNISGNILVGEAAEIEADVHARNISIAGQVRGNVSGNKVQILRTGRIWGDISTMSLAMEDGAFIDGKITMMGHSATGQESERVDDIKNDEGKDLPDEEVIADAITEVSAKTEKLKDQATSAPDQEETSDD